MAQSVLLDTELVLLEHHPAERTIVMTRTEVELPRDLDALRAFFQSLVDAIGDIDRASHVFVIDSRHAVGRNDEAFETCKREFEESLLGGFAKVSVVLDTAIGKLQVRRYNDVLHEKTMQVFDSVEAATSKKD